MITVNNDKIKDVKLGNDSLRAIGTSDRIVWSKRYFEVTTIGGNQSSDNYLLVDGTEIPFEEGKSFYHAYYLKQMDISDTFLPLIDTFYIKDDVIFTPYETNITKIELDFIGDGSEDGYFNVDLSEAFSLEKSSSSDIENHNLKEVVIHNARPTSVWRIFYYCVDLQKVTFDNFLWDECEDYRAIFSHCYSLVDVNLGSKLLTPTNCANMFNHTTSLEKVDLTLLSMEKNTATNAMFYSSSIKEITVDTWDMSCVTNVSNMFFECYNLTTINGIIKNIMVDITFEYSPLDYSTVLMLIDALYDYSDTSTYCTITFSDTTRDLLSNEDILKATNKQWNVLPEIKVATSYKLMPIKDEEGVCIEAYVYNITTKEFIKENTVLPNNAFEIANDYSEYYHNEMPKGYFIGYDDDGNEVSRELIDVYTNCTSNDEDTSYEYGLYFKENTSTTQRTICINVTLQTTDHKYSSDKFDYYIYQAGVDTPYLYVTPKEVQWVTVDMDADYDVKSNTDWNAL